MKTFVSKSLEKPSMESFLKQAAQALQSSWVKEFIDAIPKMIVVEDASGQLLHINNKAIEILKLKDHQLNDAETIHHLIQQSAAFKSYAESFKNRYTHIIKNKKTILGEVVEVNTHQIFKRDYLPILQNGNYIGAVWIWEDDTHRIQTQDNLYLQKHFFEKILFSLPLDVAVFNHQGKQILSSQHFNQNDHQWKIDYFLNSASNQIEWEESFESDNKEITVLKKLTRISNNGKTDFVIGYAIDITDRKQHELFLKRSERKYKAIFEKNQAIVCTHTLDGKLLTLNPNFCKATGYTEKELLNNNLYQLTNATYRKQIDSLYLDVIKQKKAHKGVFKIFTKQKQERYFLYHNFLLEEEDHQPYVIAFAQDITNRIRIVERLKKSHKHIEESSKEKELFLANMSHEIRTPMNGIIGLTDLLSKTTLGNSQKEYVQAIANSANHLLQIINGILDFEKLNLSNTSVDRISFNLYSEVYNTVQFFQPLIKQKKLTLIFKNYIPKELTVEGDIVKLKQIINNLIGNAIKFTHEGIITVIADAETQDNNIHFRFTVEDTGIGMTAEQLKNICLPFKQADAQIKNKYGGTGLGLAITKKLIEIQNGELHIESFYQKGSSFRFQIPYLKSTDTLENVTTTPSEKNHLGKLNILLAEDNEINKLLAKSILNYWGFEFTIASNGNEAVTFASQNNYDVILMDIQMPEKDGLEATKEIRQLKDERKATTPIIALTANALKGEEEKYLKAGMNDYITKPFKERELYQAIERVLGKQLKEVATTSTQTVDTPKSTEKLYDLSFIKELTQGDEAFIKNLISVFLSTTPQSIEELVVKAKEEKWDDVRSIAHKLKSSIDSMKIHTMSPLVRQIEEHAKTRNNLSNVHAMVLNLQKGVDETCIQLRADFQL